LQGCRSRLLFCFIFSLFLRCRLLLLFLPWAAFEVRGHVGEGERVAVGGGRRSGGDCSWSWILLLLLFLFLLFFFRYIVERQPSVWQVDRLIVGGDRGRRGARRLRWRRRTQRLLCCSCRLLAVGLLLIVVESQRAKRGR
jgi:hypothetical protein